MSSLPSQTNDGNSSVINVEIPRVIKKIHRVPPHFKKNMTHGVYDPIIVSMGPYHHGKEQFNQAQALKQVFLDGFLSKSIGNNDKSFFHGKILERIGDIRSCYEEVDYNDQALAWIILYDACFFLGYLIIRAYRGTILKYFGYGGRSYLFRDMFLLENQIPFWILKFLLCLQQGSTESGHAIWDRNLIPLLHLMVHGDRNIRNLEDYPPEYHQSFHILDAFLNLRRAPVIVKTCPDEHNNNIFKIFSAKTSSKVTKIHSGIQYRSLTNLRKKGIRFKVSNRFSFTSHPFYGLLELPRIFVTFHDFEINSNIIAYEMSSDIETNRYMTSLVSFMKSLIDCPNDVNILREEGILYSGSASDDEIVTMLKNLNTFGFDNKSIFLKVKESIERHCSSKSRTWMAELINTHFSSPLTVVALLAAFCALVLTFLQTFFTIHQK